MSLYRTNPEYLSLLKACQKDPNDNLPRLVLADWLDEFHSHDCDRAAYIRAQCAHPNHRAVVQSIHGGNRWAGVDKRGGYARQIGLASPKQARDGLRLACGWPFPSRQVEVVVTRGFASSWMGTADHWFDHADSVVPESVGLHVKLTTRPAIDQRSADHLGHQYEQVRLTRVGDWRWLSDCVRSYWDNDHAICLLAQAYPSVEKWTVPTEFYSTMNRMMAQHIYDSLPTADPGQTHNRTTGVRYLPPSSANLRTD